MPHDRVSPAAAGTKTSTEHTGRGAAAKRGPRYWLRLLAVGVAGFLVIGWLGYNIAWVVGTSNPLPSAPCCLTPPGEIAHLLVAHEDKASQDADSIVALARETCTAAGVVAQIEHHRYEGGHALTPERFQDIVTWVARQESC